MSKLRYILVVVATALLSVACERRPIEEEYMSVYLDLNIEREVLNYQVGDTEPGLMRVVFFDAVTKEYLSHDFVSHDGGYIFAPYGNVDMVVYNLESGETHVRNMYVWADMEAYTYEVSESKRNRFSRYLLSRVDTRPSYDNICHTPGHLFVAHRHNLHIPRSTSQQTLVIVATARSVVESWTIEVNGIKGLEWVGAISMMISGQVQTHFIARGQNSTTPTALYFESVRAQRGGTSITTRFETFGRELTSGDAALFSILFTDIQGHPYMYNIDVSDQMENNPQQHIVINADIDIPKPEVGGGFMPEVEGWQEYEYDIEL